MADTTPDPKVLNSWEDAFQYSVPATRRIEQQLRGELTSNGEKLRRLVGSSYRDLLGTAERIIRMDEDMQRIEANLSHVSRGCNSRVLEKTMKNHGGFVRDIKTSEEEQYTFASRMAFFHSCPTVVARLLRKGGSNLLAAKILVICRLLYKVLSQRDQTPPLVDHVRDRLASLREKLLRRIDSQFCSERLTGVSLLDNMCAFLLATSSTPVDALKHFLQVRLDGIKDLLVRDKHDHRSVGNALRLYFRSIQDVRTLLPAQLATVLLRLRSRPLIEDSELRSLLAFELELDYSRMPEEIRNYTPWLRHDLLQKGSVDSIVETWTTSTFKVFLWGLQESLATVEDPSMLMRLRRQIMETWSSQAEAGMRKPARSQLVKLRFAIASRLKQVIWDRAKALKSVGHAICDVTQKLKDEDLLPPHGLWTASMALTEVGAGATRFKTAVIDRLHGRNNPQRRIMQKYSEWLRCTAMVENIVKQLKDKTWDEELEFETDEVDGDVASEELPEDSPANIENHFGEAINSAFHDLQKLLEGAVKQMVAEENVHRASFIIRVLRDIRQHLPQYGDVRTFGNSLVPDLHRVLVGAVSKQPLQRFEEDLGRNKPASLVAFFSLWEGNPALPTQATPAVFEFLHSLVVTMAEKGGDLWTPTATMQLKMHLRVRASSVIENVLQKTTGTSSDSDETQSTDAISAIQDSVKDDESSADGQDSAVAPSGDTDKEDLVTKHTIQLLFDVMLLREALHVSAGKSSEDRLGELQERMLLNIGESLSPSNRLRQNTQDYWKRTALLFSLLS